MPSSSSTTRILPLVSMLSLASCNDIGFGGRMAGCIQRTNRQRDGERGAPADLALDVDLAAVHLDNAIDDGQPKPRSLASRLGGEERREQLPQILSRYAGTGIRHERFHELIASRARPDGDRAGALDGIG